MFTHAELSAMPVEEYAFPGPLREALVAAIVFGTKTTTTSLFCQYEMGGNALPKVGDRGVVVDSQLRPVCVTEVTHVRQASLAEVGIAHARDEGEGFVSVAEWRIGHELFWHSTQFRREMKDPHFTVGDTTEAVFVRFRSPPLA